MPRLNRIMLNTVQCWNLFIISKLRMNLKKMKNWWTLRHSYDFGREPENIHSDAPIIESTPKMHIFPYLPIFLYFLMAKWKFSVTFSLWKTQSEDNWGKLTCYSPSEINQVSYTNALESSGKYIIAFSRILGTFFLKCPKWVNFEDKSQRSRGYTEAGSKILDFSYMFCWSSKSSIFENISCFYEHIELMILVISWWIMSKIVSNKL